MWRICIIAILLLVGCGEKKIVTNAVVVPEEPQLPNPLPAPQQLSDFEWRELTVNDVTSYSPSELSAQIPSGRCEAGEDSFYEEYHKVLRSETDRRFELALRVREHIVDVTLSVFQLKSSIFGSGNHEGFRLTAYIEHEIFVGLQNEFHMYEGTYQTSIDHRYSLEDLSRLLDVFIQLDADDLNSQNFLERWQSKSNRVRLKHECLNALECAERELGDAGRVYFRYSIAQYILRSFP